MATTVSAAAVSAMRRSERRVCMGGPRGGGQLGAANIARRPASRKRELSGFQRRPALAAPRFGELSRDPAIKYSVVAAAVLLETQGRALERVENVAEVELSDGRDRLVAHCWRG